MTSSTLKRRTAATGAAGLIALGGLAVGFVSPASASQAPPTRYSCTSPVLPKPVPASVVGIVKLPTSIKAGRSMAGLPAVMKVTLPDALIHGLATQLGFTMLGGNVKNAALQVGKTNKLPLGTLTIPMTKVPPSGQNMKLKASGKTAKSARAPKQVGRYTVKMPKSFTFNPKSDAKVQTGPLACKLSGKAGSFGTLRVLR